jgi:hypothetical protein
MSIELIKIFIFFGFLYNCIDEFFAHGIDPRMN